MGQPIKCVTFKFRKFLRIRHRMFQRMVDERMLLRMTTPSSMAASRFKYNT